MRRKWFWIPTIVLLILSSASCAQAGQLTPANQPAATNQPAAANQAVPTNQALTLVPDATQAALSLPQTSPAIIPFTQAPLPASAETITQPAPGDSLTSGLVALAIKDLASRLGINSAGIDLVSAEIQELPLQDPGCLKETPDISKQKPAIGGKLEPVVPGIVMGEIIRLKADGQVYEYHGFGRRLVWCGSE